MGYERRENDFYPTPDCLGSVLAQHPLNHLLDGRSVWEPFVGVGSLLPHLAQAGAHVMHISDIHDYGVEGTVVRDFFDYKCVPWGARTLVTNPPYGRDLLPQVVGRALDLMKRDQLDTVIMLTRLEFFTGSTRAHLFDTDYYGGCVIPTWRPRWVDDTDGSPRHNFVWHYWSADDFDFMSAPTISFTHKQEGGTP